MARKTFISYKYSEAQNTRDRIIRALGRDATYYTGETSESPDMGGLKTDTIKQKLADMIFSTSVMIVIITPNVDKSEWVKWEINYATSKSTRDGRQSQLNGIVRVIDGGYQYIGEVNNLISNKADALTVTLNDFLVMPSYYIEQAYQKAGV
jgi:hypothetical protein